MFQPNLDLVCSLVSDIKDLLLALQAAICDLQLWLVEGLGLVKAVTVGSAVLVCVQVLFSSPGGTVLQLTVTFITASVGVRSLVNSQLGRVLKEL